MPPSLQHALTILMIMALTSLTTKMGMEAKDQTWIVATVAGALATLIVAGYGWLLNFFQSKKVEKAEQIVPGITTLPRGMEVKAKVTINDPKNDDPPIVIENSVNKTP